MTPTARKAPAANSPLATVVLALLIGLALLASAAPPPAAAQEPGDDVEAEVEGFASFEEDPVEVLLTPTGKLTAPEEPGDDPRRISGTRDEVCGPNNESANRRGRRILGDFFQDRWSWIDDGDLGGFACREINSGTAECDGTWYPARSTCWSTHAAGRALDIMVGGDLNQPDPPVGKARGDAIVNWLIARRAGYNGFYARTMGVMQILWNDRCWDPGNYSSDRQVTSVSQMRRCGIANHDNHPHLTLTNDGADARTSWFQPPNGMPDDVALYRSDTGAMEVRNVRANGVTELLHTGTLGADWTQQVPADLNADGRADDVLLYDRATGNYEMKVMQFGVPLFVSSGRWAAGWDHIAAGDFDGNGVVDDLVYHRNSDGRLVFSHVTSNGATEVLRVGSWQRPWTSLDVGDLDGDGLRDDLLLYNASTGVYSMQRVRNGLASGLSSGRWQTGWQHLVTGDFDGNGRMDDLFLFRNRDRRYFVTHVTNGRSRAIQKGTWRRNWSHVEAADLDNDRIVDDLLLVNRSTGRYFMSGMTNRRLQGINTGWWSTGWDDVVVGDFG